MDRPAEAPGVANERKTQNAGAARQRDKKDEIGKKFRGPRPKRSDGRDFVEKPARYRHNFNSGVRFRQDSMQIM